MMEGLLKGMLLVFKSWRMNEILICDEVIAVEWDREARVRDRKVWVFWLLGSARANLMEQKEFGKQAWGNQQTDSTEGEARLHCICDGHFLHPGTELSE